MQHDLLAGAHYLGNNQSRFSVWAPTKETVDVVLEDAGQIFALNKSEQGYWEGLIKDTPPGTKYKFRLNNGEQFPDPASRHQPDVHGWSVVADHSFVWSDGHWKGRSLNEMIIYELHTGTFTAAGDFAGVVSKLDYLADLGINTIELMPAAQFPGTRNWGYDGVYPFAVQSTYGGIPGLKNLVNQAHHRGIAVILDVVYNHQGPEGNYFSSYAPYFTDKYKTPWGSAVNYDDAWCDGVRNFYLQNAEMWLDEFHIDGLRLDAVHAIWDSSAFHFTKALSNIKTKIEDATGSKKVLIAELDLNNPRYIDEQSRGGYGLDGQWTDEFHHALHSLVTGETNGYYEDFGDITHLRKAFADSFVYTGQYSVHRKKKFGVCPNNPYHQFVVFSQNHDHIGNRMIGERLSSLIGWEALKLTAATVLLSPHVPLLFMGEEYGEKNPFQYFVSHSDNELIELIRKGRREEFAHFNWQGEVPDPQSEQTFNNCVLSWKTKEDQAALLYRYYQWLIEFRKSNPAMKGTDRTETIVEMTSPGKLIVFERQMDNNRIHIILNFDSAEINYVFEDNGRLRSIFNSSSGLWSGPSSSDQIIIDTKQPITIPAHTALIFEYY